MSNQSTIITLCLLGIFLSACADNSTGVNSNPGTGVETGTDAQADQGNNPDNSPDNDTGATPGDIADGTANQLEPAPQPDSEPAGGDISITVDPPVYRTNSVFIPHPTDIGDYQAFYTLDGYPETPDVIRMDVRINNLEQGVCTIEDQSGCTFQDLLADTDGKDEFKVEIPVHASGTDLPDDGELTNASLRQRGNSARQAPQKSFRLRIETKGLDWRNEKRLQLNKNHADATRLRNKLAFDLFRAVPHFPSLRTQFVNLWIDKGQGPEDFGLFTHTEHVAGRYLENRQLGEDDNIYKAEDFRFLAYELNALVLDEEGKPVNEDLFEQHLEIENGKDHTALVRMLEAVSDPDRSFDSVIAEHFNRNNVLTWLATNLILRQADAITHNFYLYNPAGTERFYFLPWDYDGTFEREQQLVNSFSNPDLQKRVGYGYARGINSGFVTRWYRQPGAHEELVAAIDELRTHYFSDTQILQHTITLNNLVKPYLESLPDSEYGRFEPRIPELLVASVNQNYADITSNYDLPMPPTILPDPQIDEAGFLQLEWEPAFDVTRRNTFTYDLLIASNPFFAEADIVFADRGIPDAPEGVVTYAVNTAGLSNRLFVRLIARAESDPEQFWQINNNTLRLSTGNELYGIKVIDLP